MITNEIEVVEPSDFVVPSDTVIAVVDKAAHNDSTLSMPEGASDTPAPNTDASEVVLEPPLPSYEQEELMVPTSVGVPLTVEALVGQVNGRPIYANSVLEPIADQLQASAKTKSRSQFSDFIRTSLYSETDNMGTRLPMGRMYELVITELLLTEAISSMSEEQQFGLFAVIKNMRKDLVSVEGGSQTKMRTNIEEQVGVSVDKFLKLQRDKILIDALYRQHIWPRVNVTWRDIQREFELLSLGNTVETESDTARTEKIVAALRSGISLSDIPEAFGAVTLGMIRLKQDDPREEVVIDGFERGLSFAEVASLVDVPNGGEWETFKMGVGGISDIDTSKSIKQHLLGAVEGEILAPFNVGKNSTTKVWLAVLHVQKPVSMYNRLVQIELHNILRWVQFNREKNRFVDSLWGEGSLDEVKAMADRVANIAVRRYSP